MSGLVNNQPIILSEMSEDFARGNVIPGKIALEIDPASTVMVTRSALGLKFTSPSPPPTTNALAVLPSSGGITSTVNGMVATLPTPTGVIRNLIGYDSTGAVVRMALPPIRQVFETYLATAASASLAVSTVTTGPLTTVTVTTLVEVTASGATITLQDPATVPVGTEVDIKQSGTWNGTTTVISAAGTIDGAANYSMVKTTAAQPSRSFRATGSSWLVV